MRANIVLNEYDRICGITFFPLKDGEKTYEIEEEVEELCNGSYGIVNGKIVWLGLTKEQINKQQEEKLEQLRQQRKPLLEAFDKWEKAVLRGREEDNQEIMNWYQCLLDLSEDAFEKVPDVIEYYLKNNK